jgi:hypothetical protein
MEIGIRLPLDRPRLSEGEPMVRQTHHERLARDFINATVKAVIDLLCRITNYYPTSPAATLVKEKP